MMVVQAQQVKDTAKEAAAKKKSTSTNRVARYRAKMKATSEGTQKLKARSRKDNDLYRQRLLEKQHYLEKAVAFFESQLLKHSIPLPKPPPLDGQYVNEPQDFSKKGRSYLPPREELEKMTREDLKAWRHKKRLERNKFRKRRECPKNKIKAMEARIDVLKALCREANIKPIITNTDVLSGGGSSGVSSGSPVAVVGGTKSAIPSRSIPPPVRVNSTPPPPRGVLPPPYSSHLRISTSPVGSLNRVPPAAGQVGQGATKYPFLVHCSSPTSCDKVISGAMANGGAKTSGAQAGGTMSEQSTKRTAASPTAAPAPKRPRAKKQGKGNNMDLLVQWVRAGVSKHATQQICAKDRIAEENRLQASMLAQASKGHPILPAVARPLAKREQDPTSVGVPPSIYYETPTNFRTGGKMILPRHPDNFTVGKQANSELPMQRSSIVSERTVERVTSAPAPGVCTLANQNRSNMPVQRSSVVGEGTLELDTNTQHQEEKQRSSMDLLANLCDALSKGS